MVDSSNTSPRYRLLTLLLLAGASTAVGCGGEEPGSADVVLFTTAMGQDMPIGRLVSCEERDYGTFTTRNAVFEGGRIYVWRYPEVGLFAAAVPDTASVSRGVTGAAADSLDRLARDLGC